MIKGDKSLPNRKPVFQAEDGWKFGLGFGRAMLIFIPIILIELVCLLGLVLAIILAFFDVRGVF